jgi:hypothetical protein
MLYDRHYIPDSVDALVKVTRRVRDAGDLVDRTSPEGYAAIENTLEKIGALNDQLKQRSGIHKPYIPVITPLYYEFQSWIKRSGLATSHKTLGDYVHDVRMSLEQATGIVHARAGGGRAADFLACAVKEIQPLDPLWTSHPVDVAMVS